jgi:hydrogenase expression/formation protein HypC
MCLGLPGQVLDTDTAHPDLVNAVVGGANRVINVGLLDDGEPVQQGEWLLIHMGFALSRMTDAEAQDSLDLLGTLATGSSAPE